MTSSLTYPHPTETPVQRPSPAPPSQTAAEAGVQAPASSDIAPFDPPEPPDISALITEDDTPVDNLIQEKLQRLLVDCLYSSLEIEVPFVAAADVGVFYGLKLPPLVPDVFLSLNVTIAEDWHKKEHHSYFVWEFGKPPDVAIEIVSNRKGNELGSKLQSYAQAGIPYYGVFDPLQQLSEALLQVFGLREGRYIPLEPAWMEQVQLGLRLWEGKFEGRQFQWLRWCDRHGNILLTGKEQAEQEHQRAERLAAFLRSQGVDPDQIK